MRGEARAPAGSRGMGAGGGDGGSGADPRGFTDPIQECGFFGGFFNQTIADWDHAAQSLFLGRDISEDGRSRR